MSLDMIDEHNYDDDKTPVHSRSMKRVTLMIKKKDFQGSLSVVPTGIEPASKV